MSHFSFAESIQRLVKTKLGPNMFKPWLENESKPIILLISPNTLPDLKGPTENMICTMDDVRGDFLGPLTAQHQLLH